MNDVCNRGKATGNDVLKLREVLYVYFINICIFNVYAHTHTRIYTHRENTELLFQARQNKHQLQRNSMDWANLQYWRLKLNSKISVFPGLHEIARNVISRRTPLSQLFLTRISEAETLSPAPAEDSSFPFPAGSRWLGRAGTPNKHPQVWIGAVSLLQGCWLYPRLSRWTLHADQCLQRPSACLPALTFGGDGERLLVQHLMFQNQKLPCVLTFCQMVVATDFCGHLYLAKKTGKVGSKTDL